MSVPLYTLQPRALTVLFGDLENQALNETHVLPGTPGSLLERENAGGFRFYARQYYDADGRKREQYVAGPIGQPAADAAAADMRTRLEQLRRTLADIRLLGRSGYQVADARAFATLASLHNHGVFRAGGVVVGSHAMGILLNQLGCRAAAYATEDVDLARPQPLAFAEPPAKSLLEMLQDSGISFVEVSAMSHQLPSTAWKEPGRSRFHVDLLVPSPDDSFPIVPVPELRAHALGLPFLKYLLGETQAALLVSREGCCMVRVPVPERFAVHKMLVSQLRTERSAKSGKELLQAAILLSVLAEHHPGAIEDALEAAPESATRHLRAAAEQIRHLVEPAHPRVVELLHANAR